MRGATTRVGPAGEVLAPQHRPAQGVPAPARRVFPGTAVFELRPYQLAAVEGARAQSRNRPVIVAPTGAGKTVLASQIAVGAVERGNRVLWLAHRKELVEQAEETLQAVGLTVGLIASGYDEDRAAPVQVASIQTLIRRDLPPADVVIVDECHHARSASFETVLAHYPGAAVVGLTATPCRLDGKGLGHIFGALVQPDGLTVRGLIDQGYLSRFQYFAPSEPNMHGVKKLAGDYAKGEMEKRVIGSSITGDAAREYLRYLPGKRALVFAASIDHSRMVVDAFNAEGVPAEHLDGTTKREDRAAALERLRTGETLVLSNVALFCEGLDLPGLDAVILLRPTQSLSLHRQAIGRALRTAPGKTIATILDHAGSWRRHGLPDTEIQWDLEDRPSRRFEDAGVRRCPSCRTVVESRTPTCVACGHEFVPVEREDLEHLDGELVQILEEAKKPKRIKATMDEKRAAFADLVDTARRRGNKLGWASRQYQQQFGVWPRGMKLEREAAFDACEHVRTEDVEDEFGEVERRCRFCSAVIYAQAS